MKEFRVAHIVPVAHLEDTVDMQYHMCLAHLVDNEEYRKHFAAMSATGRFVLMDNGAAEGAQLPPDRLLAMYAEIEPAEIVLPDTLFEPGSTIQKSRNFMRTLDEAGLSGKYRLMAVPQGRTLREWEACARIFVKDTRVNTIGVSKFLNIATKDRTIRFAACNCLQRLIEEYGRYDLEVHLLGCDEGPLLVKMIHEKFPFVRGCDSAFAYLQAQAGKMMTLNDDKRPEGVIDFIGGVKRPGFLRFVNNFNEFAGVQDNGRSVSWETSSAWR